MDKSKLLKLFIILFKHEMFNYLKEPFYLLGEGLIVLKESIVNLVEFILCWLYAALLFAVYPLRPIQFFFRAIKYRKDWATEERYNKLFGDKDDICIKN